MRGEPDAHKTVTVTCASASFVVVAGVDATAVATTRAPMRRSKRGENPPSAMSATSSDGSTGRRVGEDGAKRGIEIRVLIEVRLLRENGCVVASSAISYRPKRFRT